MIARKTRGVPAGGQAGATRAASDPGIDCGTEGKE